MKRRVSYISSEQAPPASAAVPPSLRMRTPMAAARGCVQATMPFVEYTGERLLFHFAVLTFFFSMMKLIDL